MSNRQRVTAFQGDYDPSRTKVLQLTMNPFSTAQRKLTAELDQLRGENRRLTKRLQIVEESRGAATVNLSARVDSELQASSGKEVEGDRGMCVIVLVLFVIFSWQPDF